MLPFPFSCSSGHLPRTVSPTVPLLYRPVIKFSLTRNLIERQIKNHRASLSSIGRVARLIREILLPPITFQVTLEGEFFFFFIDNECLITRCKLSNERRINRCEIEFRGEGRTGGIVTRNNSSGDFSNVVEKGSRSQWDVIKLIGDYLLGTLHYVLKLLVSSVNFYRIYRGDKSSISRVLLICPFSNVVSTLNGTRVLLSSTRILRRRRKERKGKDRTC